MLRDTCSKNARQFCFRDFQCNLCGAEKANEEFLQEVEDKEQ